MVNVVLERPPCSAVFDAVCVYRLGWLWVLSTFSFTSAASGTTGLIFAYRVVSHPSITVSLPCLWPPVTYTYGLNHSRLCKLLSLTYKVLTTSQPDYLHNLISIQSTGITRSSSLVTLARPPVSSSLQITNRSFIYASPYLWNQLPSFRQPYSVHSPPGSPHPALITSSQSPPSLSPSITPSVFHSRLKTHLFHKSFPP